MSHRGFLTPKPGSWFSLGMPFSNFEFFISIFLHFCNSFLKTSPGWYGTDVKLHRSESLDLIWHLGKSPHLAAVYCYLYRALLYELEWNINRAHWKLLLRRQSFPLKVLLFDVILVFLVIVYVRRNESGLFEVATWYSLTGFWFRTQDELILIQFRFPV